MKVLREGFGISSADFVLHSLNLLVLINVMNFVFLRRL